MLAKHNQLKKSFAVVLLVASALIGLPAWAANDPARTAPGYINVMEAGWGADSVSIELTSPLINPAVCPIWQSGYVSDVNDPGRGLYHDILREAWVYGRRVELLISGVPGDCPSGKPRIISVRVVR